MTTEFGKLLDLVQRTGDRLVIYNAAADQSFVLLPLQEYEQHLSGSPAMSGLTEEELLAKINRDIARWRAEQKSEKSMTVPSPVAADAGVSVPVAVPEQSEAAGDIYQFEPIEEEKKEIGN
ncbi:hypothetical protein HY933_00320 [Candidatus Falkowbacteria bacterium]|nr:hypothetical protein [Candidatus Falkowbacteria bacterium]